MCLSDDGIALNGIQLCSILIRFLFPPFINVSLSVRFMFHPHEHSDLLNGFLFSLCCTLTNKSVFRSPVCCDHDNKWSLNLKKAMNNNQHFEHSQALLYQAKSKRISSVKELMVLKDRTSYFLYFLDLYAIPYLSFYFLCIHFVSYFLIVQ